MYHQNYAFRYRKKGAWYNSNTMGLLSQIINIFLAHIHRIKLLLASYNRCNSFVAFCNYAN